MSRKKTLEEFISEAKNIHGDKYDYSKSEYNGNKVKVLIHCNECNSDFWQAPAKHLAGQ